ncbi:transglutaminase domain-containing protein [Ascidiimonas aurantiaca]|uniref:transglutaminase domain-containing protein n=1 Tax=Ascidiimonas aurantiaca TaxID=1685432 RepID=UPI0030EC3AF6
MRLTLFCAFLLFSLNSLLSQNIQHAEVWKALLQNDREEALRLFEENHEVNDLRSLLMHEILKVENGHLNFENPEAPFYEKLASYPDYEYFLYALWNNFFVFNDYLDSGFNAKIEYGIKTMFEKDISLPLVKESLRYLNSVVYRNEWATDTYTSLQDEMNFIKSWQFCGTFENLNNSGLDHVYPPETDAAAKEPFNANSNGYVNWYTPYAYQKEAYQFFSNHMEYGAGVNYAQTFIRNEQAREVVLRMGFSGAFKVWLNGVLIHQQEKELTTDLDAYHIKVNLPRGTNRLLVKLATGNTVPYLIARITDEKGNSLEGITASAYEETYQTSTWDQIAPQLIEHPIEAYFKEKLEQFPDDLFYKYCLIKTYLRNQRYEKAMELLAPMLDVYPKSSFLRKQLIYCYSIEGDQTSLNELNENMELDDPDYYIPIIAKLKEWDRIFEMDIEEFNDFLSRFSQATDLKLFQLTSNFMRNARASDLEACRGDLDDIIDEAVRMGNFNLIHIYAPLYNNLFNAEEKTIELLEYINKKRLDYAALKRLLYYYDKLGKKEKVIESYQQVTRLFGEENQILKDFINQLHTYERFEESLPVLKKGLDNFPYSFVLMKLKGDALLRTGAKKEALEMYRKSLVHNPGDTDLRDKIRAIEGKKDPLDALITKNIYELVKERRGTLKDNNYGYNFLIDDNNVVLYPEGGSKTHITLAYEITSESAIDTFKEYDLGLSGNYTINKSEIIKPDGSVVPAESNRSSFVFNGLAVGDVVHFDYISYGTGSGRFYKDYVDYYQFDYFGPSFETSYKILVPNEITLNHKVVNGALDFEKEKMGDYTLYRWSLRDNPGFAPSEDYMPSVVDESRYLHLSTLDSWSEISTWYSDLVRSSLRPNKVVQDVYDTLFENGASMYTDEEKARRIYAYIANNMNYSYVDFRQSGFVPQKPYKTINTGLGDCKDFSTLFVTLARKAGLDASLVLVLTSDHGSNALILPSQDFNHCIVKVDLDGSDQFLELTDKHLPFRSLPTSLHGANALEIPFSEDGGTYDLFKINDPQRTKAVFEVEADLVVKEDIQHLEMTISTQGHISSYYSSRLEEPNPEVMKQRLKEDLSGRIHGDFSLDSLHVLKNEKITGEVSFKSFITINEKVNKMGQIYFFQLPDLARTYTNAIISLDKRNFGIDYAKYENTDIYKVNYTVRLKSGERFTEIPENKELTFGEHRFKITYQQISDHELKVSLEGYPSKEIIAPDAYPEFKKYVKDVLESVESFIGYRQI